MNKLLSFFFFFFFPLYLEFLDFFSVWKRDGSQSSQNNGFKHFVDKPYLGIRPTVKIWINSLIPDTFLSLVRYVTVFTVTGLPKTTLTHPWLSSLSNITRDYPSRNHCLSPEGQDTWRRTVTTENLESRK